MDKLTYCKRFMLWTAIVVAVVMGILGLCFGKVVEESLFAEIAKWVVVSLGVICVAEVFAYIFAPLVWHIKNDGKDNGENLGMD